MAIIERLCAKNGTCKIIDLGGTAEYWTNHEGLLDDYDITIDLVNLTAPASLPKAPFRIIEADACDLHFLPENSYDLVHSNSVLEHVGSWQRMEAFAREVRRLAKCYFIQVPYFWFPVEP